MHTLGLSKLAVRESDELAQVEMYTLDHFRTQ